MPRSKASSGKSAEGEGLRLDLLLGYDPTRASSKGSSRSAKVTSSDRHRRPESKKSSSHRKPACHPDDHQHTVRPRLVPRESQRNESPWTPENSCSSREQLASSDQTIDDIFSHACDDPRLCQLSESWRKQIVDGRLYHRAGRTGTPAIPESIEPDSDLAEDEMPSFNIFVIGYPQVGKSCFIADALNLDKTNKTKPATHRKSFEVDGKKVWVKVAETSINFNPNSKDKSKQESEELVAPPLDIDGAIVLYDTTRRGSLAAIPIILRTYQEAGVPLLLVSTKGDCDVGSRQLNPDVVEQKARLLVNGLTSFQSSVKSRDGAQRCINILVRDIAHRYQERQQREGSVVSSVQTPRANGKHPPSVFLEDRSTPPSVFLEDDSAESGNNSDSHSEDLQPDRHRQSRRASSPTVPLTMSPTQAAHNTNPFFRNHEKASAGRTAGLDGTESEVDDASRNTSVASRSKPQEEFAPLRDAATPEAPGIDECTFDDLVDRLLQSTTPAKDSKYAYRFLSLYRMFASPLQLLNSIIKHCFAPYGEAAADAMSAIDGHVFIILHLWASQYPGDFILETTRNRLMCFLDALDDEDEPFPAAIRIRNAIAKGSRTDDMYWGVLSSEDTYGDTGPPSPKVPPTPPRSADGSTSSLAANSAYFGSESDLSVVFRTRNPSTLNAMGPSDIQYGDRACHNSSQVSIRAQRLAATLVPQPGQPFGKPQWRGFMAQSEDAIARELTRIDWILLSAVTPRDLIRHTTVKDADRPRFPALANVTRLVAHFNYVANWAANLILIRDKPKHRCLMYEKLVRVARELRKLNNYSSLGAVVAGISEISVHRLGQTRSLVQPPVTKDFMQLDILMSVQGGYRTYRTAWEHTDTARIPFLPLHLRDITMAEMKNKTYIEHEVDGESSKMINWTKFDIIGGVLQEFQSALSAPYPPFRTNEEVKNLLFKAKLLNQDELYERSVALESASSVASPNAGGMHQLQNNLKRLLSAP